MASIAVQPELLADLGRLQRELPAQHSFPFQGHLEVIPALPLSSSCFSPTGSACVFLGTLSRSSGTLYKFNKAAIFGLFISICSGAAEAHGAGLWPRWVQETRTDSFS